MEPAPAMQRHSGTHIFTGPHADLPRNYRQINRRAPTAGLAAKRKCVVPHNRDQNHCGARPRTWTELQQGTANLLIIGPSQGIEASQALDAGSIPIATIVSSMSKIVEQWLLFEYVGLELIEWIEDDPEAGTEGNAEVNEPGRNGHFSRNAPAPTGTRRAPSPKRRR